MGARAESSARTRQKILDAAYELFFALPYDEVTLQTVADKAGVAVQTVLRHVGTKEGLILAGIDKWTAEEHARRVVEPGDVVAAARMLAERYEELGDLTFRLRSLEERVPAVAEAIDVTRKDHLRWLAEVFFEALPKRARATRARRLAQLFGATEIIVWTTWRHHLGMTRAQAEAAMADSLEALLAAWKTHDERSRR